MIKKIIYISILFGLISFQGLCDNTIDTLELQLQTAKDTNRVKILCDLCWEYRFVSAEHALKYGDEALELANQLGFKKGLPKHGLSGKMASIYTFMRKKRN